MQLEDASKTTPPEPIPSKDPLIRLYGRTSLGQSIVVFTYGFYPYIYYSVTPSFNSEHLVTVKTILEEKSGKGIDIVDIQIVTREPLMYYRPGDKSKYSNFLQIWVRYPSMISKLQKFLEQGDIPESPLSMMFQKGLMYDTTVYEANLAFEIRIMVDKNLVGGGWVGLKKEQYTVMKTGFGSANSDIVVICPIDSIYSKSTSYQDKAWSSNAELRIMCVMITTILDRSRTQSSSSTSSASTSSNLKKRATPIVKKAKKSDSSSSKHPVISTLHVSPATFIGYISVYLTTQYAKEQESNPDNIKNQDSILIFTHGKQEDLDPSILVPGYKIIWYPSEREMILGWHQCLRTYDPDIICGYDTVEHLVMIMERGESIQADSVRFLSRINDVKSTATRQQTYSANWVRSQR